MIFETTVDIAFGNCDSTQIEFYPDHFAWFDVTFHAFLRSCRLDHRIVTQELGTAGFGLIDAGPTFQSPATFGDHLML